MIIIEVPICKKCGNEMRKEYSTRSLSDVYICDECNYDCYERSVDFKTKKLIEVEKIKEALTEIKENVCFRVDEDFQKEKTDGYYLAIKDIELKLKELRL